MIKYTDVSLLTKKDLYKYSIEDLVYIYMAAFKFPNYYSLGNKEHQTILHKGFLEFIKDTKYSLNKQKFIEKSKLYWNIILLEESNVIIKPTELPLFSYFSRPITNTKPKAEINILQLYEVIKNPKYFAKQTKELRNLTDINQYKAFKTSQFDYVTFSGTFEKRNSQSLIKHSGYICLDIDHLKENISQLKSRIIADSNLDTLLLFTSPSGQGLKVILQFDLINFNHQTTYLLLENYFQKIYHIQIDKACKNIDRACFICYDPEIFINSKLLHHA